MGLIEFHVDRIEVRTVPKFVLFGGRDGPDRDESTGSDAAGGGRNLPVTPAQIVAVSVGATLLAFALARLKGLVDEKLSLHC
ncbi:MAG: hypothetical protein U5K70_06500 [Halodesulfurarchaeum sp.]|nr:hypothetical protein [Halodesulfurarchaeum sp.]